VNGQNTFGVDVFDGVSESDGLFDGSVTLGSHFFEFVPEIGDFEVKFSVIHLLLPFFAPRVVAVFAPFFALSKDRLRALAASSDLPNGESLRMLNAFGSGHTFSSMFMSSPA
jgi:hypothetical protein